jgi:hypothetical protein
VFFIYIISKKLYINGSSWIKCDQLVTQTAAGTAGFVLKSGQSNVTSLKCMTRADAGLDITLCKQVH